MQKGITGGRKTSDLCCSKCLDHGKLMMLFEFSSYASRARATRHGTSRSSPPCGTSVSFSSYLFLCWMTTEARCEAWTAILRGAFVRFVRLSFRETCAFGGGLL